jgi:hypothetical protein
MARIIYHLLRFRQPYDESVFAHLEQSNLQKTELRLRLQAAKLGFQLIQARDAGYRNALSSLRSAASIYRAKSI